MRLACFISPHGFGHATRTSAILGACRVLRPDCRFDLFTRVPSWLFEETLSGCYEYHATASDVGFAQRSALEIDVPATLRALAAFLPFARTEVRRLAETVRRNGCRAVLCDISPLGISVARAAGVPSVLVENFTWDWLYEPYQAEFPEFHGYRKQLAEIYAEADYHVQLTPACTPSATAHLLSAPVARPARRERTVVRDELGVAPGNALVLITLGGVPQPLGFIDRLRRRGDIQFLITGAPEDRREDNLIIFAQTHRLYMPDLIRASDAVVTKLGYGTVAEVYAEGKPLAYVCRDFRESESLRDFVRQEIPGMEIAECAFARGDWLEDLNSLLALPPRPRPPASGARMVAEFLVDRLGNR